MKGTIIKYIKVIQLMFLLTTLVESQAYVSADPYFLLPLEKDGFNKKDKYANLIRPFFVRSPKPQNILQIYKN